MTTPDTTESQISEQDTTRHFFALLSRFILTLKKDAPGESSLKLHSHLFFILFTLNRPIRACSLWEIWRASSISPSSS